MKTCKIEQIALDKQRSTGYNPVQFNPLISFELNWNTPVGMDNCAHVLEKKGILCFGLNMGLRCMKREADGQNEHSGGRFFTRGVFHE